MNESPLPPPLPPEQFGLGPNSGEAVPPGASLTPLPPSGPLGQRPVNPSLADNRYALRSWIGHGGPESEGDSWHLLELVFLVLLAVGFTVGRFFVGHVSPSPTGTYTALAHLYVGWLFAAAMFDRSTWRWLYLAFALFLSGVELLAFLITRHA